MLELRKKHKGQSDEVVEYLGKDPKMGSTYIAGLPNTNKKRKTTENSSYCDTKVVLIEEPYAEVGP